MIREEPNFTLQELRAKYEYHPNTGHFTRKTRLRDLKVGDIAGHLHVSGYVVICIRQKSYRVHQLAWFYMTDEWPTFYLDHKNRIRSDNRWENLRKASSAENSANAGMYSTNTSGFKGVSWARKQKKWRMDIVVNGVGYREYHDDILEAAAAYDRRALICNGEFAVTNAALANEAAS